MDLLKFARDYGLAAVFAFLFWTRITSVQDSMQRDLATNAAQASQRESRMADQITSLEKQIQGELKETIEAQKVVLREATHAIRDNTDVMIGLKAMLPKQP